MMKQDKWWLTEAEQPGQAKTSRRRLAADLTRSLISPGQLIKAFYSEVMRRKHDDHVASHSDRTNQFLHLVSSSAFLVCYVLVFSDLVTAMWIGLGALFLRQMGHALIEPPCHDKEQLLLGYDTRSKSVILALYVLIPVANCFAAQELSWATAASLIGTVALQWFAFTGLVILFRVAVLIRKHGAYNATIWFVKLITDPVTDVIAYYSSALPRRRVT